MADTIAARPDSLNFESSKSSNIMKSAMYNVHFKNWAETFECRPDLFFAPKTEKDMSEILQLARQEKRGVKVVGCKRSPSDIACTNDIMISLQNFNKLIQIDKKLRRVKVQGGMVLSDLNDILYSNNLALSVLGSVSDVTVAGAISVATHGTGMEYGVLSSYVTELDLMIADGSIMNLSMENSDGTFQAALCGLGALGIIVTVTLQCEEAFQLELRQYGLSLSDVIENLDVHISGSDYFRFMWFPYTDSVVVCHSNKTEASPIKDSWLRQLWKMFWEYGVGYHFLEFCYYVSTFFPNAVPYINRFFYYSLFSSPSTAVDRSYRILNYECLFKQYVNEWAIPIEKTGVALWQLREWLESASSLDIYVHFPIEVRFVKADNIFLSPAYGRNTCYINVIMYRPYGKSTPYEIYWSAYEKIMMEHDGRPHWAKAHSVTASYFATCYPFFNTWCTIRQKLDPGNMFVNPYLLRILS